MSELAGDPEERWRMLDAGRAYADILSLARLANDCLTTSWQTPEHHNRTTERAALFYTLLLDDTCQLALAEYSDVRFSRVASIALRYDVYAAMLTVQDLPFMQDERSSLLTPEARSNHEFENEAAVPDRSILEGWHQWLWWTGDGGIATKVEELGDSILLAEGCKRLAAILPGFIDAIGVE